MTNADAFGLHDDRGTPFEFVAAADEHRLQKVRQILPLQSFDPDADHGGFRRVRQGKQRMKVGIQGHDDAGFVPTELQDNFIGSRGVPDFANVDGIEPDDSEK